ncbi:MAG: 4-hydroxythreonine-4-phosphate dehydrogenase PdxA [Desulfobulbales bacterium]|nr:4-hydroxythreonine-4-phosphate dehydrogenase PdxA [Desulfobulbales bacterium]
MHNADNENNDSRRRPKLVAISMGCPVGIGPEIILSFLAEGKLPQGYLPVVAGDIGVLQRLAKEMRLNREIISWQPGKEVDPEKIQVVEPVSSGRCSLQSEKLQWGKPGKETGHAAVAYIRAAVSLVKRGVCDALVTCPIAKHVIQQAGYDFPGHTEMLASLCDTGNYGMMMAGNRLKVSLVTIHTPLARVAGELSRTEVSRIIELTGKTLVSDFGITIPHIAVAGFNPHSGEASLFGDEEKNIIAPAIAAAASDKWKLTGPLPPDTVFKMALDSRFDAVVAMYHDQGLIPFKLVHFEDGVNFTMGLPLIRTSVDHGTAYDIAGKGLASHTSLAAAFLLATEIAGNRRKLENTGQDPAVQRALD